MGRYTLLVDYLAWIAIAKALDQAAVPLQSVAR